MSVQTTSLSLVTYDNISERDNAIFNDQSVIPTIRYLGFNKTTKSYDAFNGISWSPLNGMITPSGDATGLTDRTTIVAFIAANGHCYLDVGTFYIDETITLANSRESITGSGRNTILTPVGDINAITLLGNDFNVIKDLYISGGVIGILIDDACRALISNVQIQSNTSDGIKLQNGVWQVVVQGCEFHGCGGNGISAISTVTYNNGNALAVHGCQIEGCEKSGIEFAAFGMSVLGCTIQGNGDTSGSGILLDITKASATTVVISGNYFEDNGAIAGIEMRSDAAIDYAVVGCNIVGNIFNEAADTPSVFASGDGVGKVRGIYIDDTNYTTGSANVKNYQFGSNVRFSTILGIPRATQDMNYAYEAQNLYLGREASPVRTETYTVACDEDKTDQAVDLIILKKDTVILEISAKCVEAMNGTGVKTFEVGVIGNADNYIDLVDFDPSTLNNLQAMTWGGANDQSTSELITDAFEYIRCIWTNTGGTPSAGSVEVRLTYSPACSANNVVAVP